MKACDVTIGQRIMLDVGYGHPMDEACLVVKVVHGENGFYEPVIRFTVRLPDGTTMQVFDHLPTDTVELAE